MNNDNMNPLTEAQGAGHENCAAILEIETQSGVPRASFVGVIKDAPGCATMIANTLSQQAIHEVNVLLEETTGLGSDLLVSFDQLDVSLGSAAYPYVQPPALEGLRKAIEQRGKTMVVNSAYRTLAQQSLLFDWWRDGVCNFQAVAPPGSSYHQAGLAIDIQNPEGWRNALENHGWQWFGAGDRPHFTYRGSDAVDAVNINGISIDIRDTATLAFQRLWNRNHPEDTILEDGQYGTNTERRLKKSPANGFSLAPWDQKPRVLRLSVPRMEGSDVERVQTTIEAADIAVDVDGVFGPGTEAAIKEFQEKNNLVVNGIVDHKMLGTLA